MPELAEVELARRTWELGHNSPVRGVEVCSGARIFRKCKVEELSQILLGQSICSSQTHGKRLFFTFQEYLHLEIHLGMSGRLSIGAIPYQLQKHDHFVLFLDELALVLNDYRQFGQVILHKKPAPWAVLPVEILSDNFTLDYLNERLLRRKGSKIKALLLDQSLFPGVGNWMADEICWVLRRHPGTLALEVEIDPLLKATRDVCRGAIKYVAEGNSVEVTKEGGFSPGTYVSNVPPPDWLFQHRWKKGGICPRCHSTLERGTIATRTTAWCRICQV